ncbi:hypothetical protein [Polynucleobacter sp. IMCC 29146]|uniref:hypothetical protein n=1 Tax=Polynucleobacter sp. IMCC 29146 TaxID=2780953 RepID=UPI001F298FA2|nr:hypothetical protein [Polynucleobacter sp. IMCC 29146]MCE7530452.1 hypothetical protein [Polynucleobacter sp. IMCC 29146]
MRRESLCSKRTPFTQNMGHPRHSWKLVGSAPWKRAYIVLAPGAAVAFKANKAQQ